MALMHKYPGRSLKKKKRFSYGRPGYEANAQMKLYELRLPAGPGYPMACWIHMSTHNCPVQPERQLRGALNGTRGGPR